MVRQMQKIAMYSLPSREVEENSEARRDAPIATCEKEFDILVLTRKVGESILVPTQGMTIQVEAIDDDQVSLRITVPAETRVFRMGVR